MVHDRLCVDDGLHGCVAGHAPAASAGRSSIFVAWERPDAVSGSVMKALELCQLPPDVEIMTSIMKQALQSATTEQAKDVHLGLVNLQQKPRDEEVKIPPKSKEMSIFLDILKRAQG